MIKVTDAETFAYARDLERAVQMLAQLVAEGHGSAGWEQRRYHALEFAVSLLPSLLRKEKANE